MVKAKFEHELDGMSRIALRRMCEGKGLPHTGDKRALIARLVEWEKSQSEEPEPEAPVEPETPPPEEPPVEKSQSPRARARHTAR